MDRPEKPESSYHSFFGTAAAASPTALPTPGGTNGNRCKVQIIKVIAQKAVLATAWS